jgi:hypothetical protein
MNTDHDKQHSTFSNSAREEISQQLTEPQPHSNKDSTCILPQPIKYILPIRNFINTVYTFPRSTHNATIVHSSSSHK